jgi:DNA-binding MarR family transcriptional regulator
MNSNPLSPRAIQQRLMRINRLHRAAIEKRMSATGIHRSQHMILMYLNRCDSSVSQKEIAAHFDISPAAVTVSLKKLEAGGYIRRSCSENDNRFNEIEMTKKGKDVVNFSHDIFESIDNLAFEGIKADEMHTLAELLDKILGNLNDNYGKEN